MEIRSKPHQQDRHDAGGIRLKQSGAVSLLVDAVVSLLLSPAEGCCEEQKTVDRAEGATCAGNSAVIVELYHVVIDVIVTITERREFIRMFYGEDAAIVLRLVFALRKKFQLFFTLL